MMKKYFKYGLVFVFLFFVVKQMVTDYHTIEIDPQIADCKDISTYNIHLSENTGCSYIRKGFGKIVGTAVYEDNFKFYITDNQNLDLFESNKNGLEKIDETKTKVVDYEVDIKYYVLNDEIKS